MLKSYPEMGTQYAAHVSRVPTEDVIPPILTLGCFGVNDLAEFVPNMIMAHFETRVIATQHLDT